ncbi:MAG: hypothetical protein C0406_04645 [Sideroxydans sp.]|nr:hypothetical protein [Sideroxydans sp.]
MNTLLNLTGGGLMLLYALLLPGILARAMPIESFGAYLLGVQFVPFLMLLATPIQQSLAPRFAQMNSEGGVSGSVELFGTAISLLAFIGFFATVISIVASLLLPSLLNWSEEFASVASKSIAILGVATSLTFPILAVTAYSSGRQDFLWENLFKCGGPFVGLATVSIWIFFILPEGNQQLEPANIIYLFALVTILMAILIGYFGSRHIPFEGRIFGKLDRVGLINQISIARGVLWWQLCALLTLSVAPFIVSGVEPEKVAAFAVTASLMTVIAGLSGALAGPFAVKMAQYAKSDVRTRTDLFLKLQRPFQLFLIASTLVVLMLPQWLLNIWVGNILAQQIPSLLMPLAIANLFRQMTGPYTTALLGLGQQNLLWLSPAVEAIGSVIFGTVLGFLYGAEGVAYGVLIAATFRLILTATHDLPATKAFLRLSILDIALPFNLKIFKA